MPPPEELPPLNRSLNVVHRLLPGPVLVQTAVFRSVCSLASQSLLPLSPATSLCSPDLALPSALLRLFKPSVPAVPSTFNLHLLYDWTDRLFPPISSSVRDPLFFGFSTGPVLRPATEPLLLK